MLGLDHEVAVGGAAPRRDPLLVALALAPFEQGFGIGTQRIAQLRGRTLHDLPYPCGDGGGSRGVLQRGGKIGAQSPPVMLAGVGLAAAARGRHRRGDDARLDYGDPNVERPDLLGEAFTQRLERTLQMSQMQR